MSSLMAVIVSTKIRDRVGIRMNRNIELKARCPDLTAAHRVAKKIPAVLHGEERQRDTYFRIEGGRLKLRERWLGRTAASPPNGPGSSGDRLPSQLIWYRRTDEARPRPSDYALVIVHDSDGLRELLSGALGVVTEVNKHRTIYLYDNVRIHLDDVAGLGTYVEFEAIVDENSDDAAARRKIDFLLHAFGIEPGAVASRSYGELIGS